MYNNLTSSQKENLIASRNQDQDDDFFSDPKFLEAAAEIENAIMKLIKVVDRPTFSLRITPHIESGENQPNEEDVEMFNNAAFSDVQEPSEAQDPPQVRVDEPQIPTAEK
ncbi:conserved hypothetical protein [Ricinus communis]|uniref:Uncharacterized protein n=1 Tax=Ricinus communis TaxID=3988 RepID=B9T822_RICCO|nr:conserved hypothetical protein [Ricinus communis]